VTGLAGDRHPTHWVFLRYQHVLEVRFGSLAVIKDNISLMSAFERKADVFRFNFGTLRPNVRFSRKRTFKLLEIT